MITPIVRGMSRRSVLQIASGLLAGSEVARWARADDRPPVTAPRATSGDAGVEPDWEQRLRITVGPEKADLTGRDDKVVQAAVDYVARLGGGTVHVLPGRYEFRNAVHLQSGVRILGSGADSVLRKTPSRSTGLADDSDWYDQEITLASADGFEIGDGIFLRSGKETLKRTLVARSGRRFKLTGPCARTSG